MVISLLWDLNSIIFLEVVSPFWDPGNFLMNQNDREVPVDIEDGISVYVSET